MFIVSVLNTKGGVGKTTLSIVCAKHISRLGTEPKNVRVLDLDPAGEVSGALAHGKRRGSTHPRPTLAGFYEAWDILGVDFSKGKPLDVLRDAVEALGDVYAVVIDSKPSAGSEELIAAAVADLVLVPVTPGIAEVNATEHVVRRLQKIQAENGNGSPKIGIAPTRWVKRSKTASQNLEALKSLGVPVLEVVYASNTVQETAAEGTLTVMRKCNARKEYYKQVCGGLDLIKEVL